MDIIYGDIGIISGLVLAIKLSAIPLGVSLVVGLFVSVLQAATQIQDSTLTFIPKVVAVCIALFVFGGWMGGEVIEYFSTITESIATNGRVGG